MHDPQWVALCDDGGCGGFTFGWITLVLIITEKGEDPLPLFMLSVVCSPSYANLPTLRLLYMYYHFAPGPACHSLDAACTTGPETH